MNYRYDSETIDGQKVFHITEKLTKLVVAKGLDWENANQMTKRLNGGSGFAGWTPSFFTEALRVSSVPD